MRKSKAWHAVREAGAAWELQKDFNALFEAAIAFRDRGDFDAFEIALDALRYDPTYTGFPALDEAMPRDKRIAVLAARYVTVSQFTDRMRKVAGELDAYRRDIGDEMRLTVAERDDIPEYARLLLKNVMAQGIGQPDLHPASRALASVIATAIREYNLDRRSKHEFPDDYSDLPVDRWASLPTMFAGVALVELTSDEAKWPEPFPLPPSPDIASFTRDRVRPPFGKDRLSTIRDWSTIIEDWAQRNDKPVAGMQVPLWALLLAHRMPNDTSDLARLNGLEVQSPWRAGHVARVDVLPEPEDDVPY